MASAGADDGEMDMNGQNKTSRGGCGGKGHLPWGWARERAWALGQELTPAPRELPLEQVTGGVLGADVRALAGLPAFDAAAMDGFAVSGQGPWRLVGRRMAGAAEEVCAGLGSGEAVEIATGARVPKNTESVLPYEQARTTDGVVEGESEPGRHVRWTGEEISPGEIVLTRGHVVSPAVMGLAASLGHDTLPVVLPRVAVVITGEEVAVSGLPGEGLVRDAIGPVVPGVLSWAGAQLEHTVRLGDGRAELAKVLRRSDVDVIAVCGSSSRGPADHVREVLAEQGADMVVDGVSCRPGHPQLLARTGDRAVVGLPGNPGAALVGALTLLVPLVTAMAGRPDPGVVPGRVPLGGDVRAHAQDTRLVAVRVEEGRAFPVGHDRPGSLRGAASAEAYAVVPPGWVGEDVELVCLPS